MRIVLDGRYLGAHYPGIGRYVYNLASALPRAAAEIELLLLVDPSPDEPRFALEPLAASGVELVPVPFAPRTLAEQRLLPSTLRRLAPDLYHAPFWWLARGALRREPPLVLTHYDLIPLQHPPSMPRRLRRIVYRLAVARATRNARRVLTLSQAAKSELTSRLRLPADRIDVTPGAPDPRLGPPSAEEVARLRRSLALERPYVLYLGSRRPHKNLDRLEAAWQQVARKRSDVELLLAGFDGDGDSLEGHGSVRRLGPVPEAQLAPLLGGATALVLPSLVEGFGLPVLEAMACGTAVACSAIPSLEETAGDAALLFDPLDADDMAGALSSLLADPELRERLITAGRRRAAELSWAETARLTLAAYEAALGATDAGPRPSLEQRT